jgi:hypothetical protein
MAWNSRRLEKNCVKKILIMNHLSFEDIPSIDVINI